MRALLFVVVALAAVGSACSSGGAGGACSMTSDCSGGAECVYRIGSCSVSGECLPPGGGASQCGAIEEVCGCGTNVATGCGYPQGYASGPTTGQTSCH
jgi:hypothetical protein